MYEVELSEAIKLNPQASRICLVMDIVKDHFKDYNDYMRNKVDSSLRMFVDLVKKDYEANDNKVDFYHQTLINYFYRAMHLPMQEVKKSGNKVYFVDFIGRFNMNIYERCTYFQYISNKYGVPTRHELIVDLFDKKIADFEVSDMSIAGNYNGAHVFKFKQDCDIFCYFVTILNENLFKA